MTNRHPPVEDWATDFDHTDPEWAADPYLIWDELRQRCPVAHSDRYGGTWLPVTHDLVPRTVMPLSGWAGIDASGPTWPGWSCG